MTGDPLLPPHSSLLTRFRDLLAAAPLNLTSVRDAQEIERRHIGESLLVVHALEQAGRLPAGSRVIDVGSGGGLPGIPLAVARPDTRVTLLEATGKKAAFLERAARDLELANVRVLAVRAEEAAHNPEEREAYDLAVARAVAQLATLLELTLPFVRVGGALAAVKGSRAEEEIMAAQDALQRCGGGPVESLPLATDAPNLRLLIVPKIRSTPADLPRRPGIPAKKPL
ncbi:MAG: 16S rRNA (guanine(527)-N(7))-methyltransferase RsmG [Dehalococcoidia bacterium]